MHQRDEFIFLKKTELPLKLFFYPSKTLGNKITVTLNTQLFYII